MKAYRDHTIQTLFSMAVMLTCSKEPWRLYDCDKRYWWKECRLVEKYDADTNCDFEAREHQLQAERKDPDAKTEKHHECRWDEFWTVW